MRIVLDGGPLSVETGGIRRYVECLALALKSLHPQDEVHVVADRALNRVAALRDGGVVIHDGVPVGLSKRWWVSGISRLCRTLQADIFHGTDFHVPYRHSIPAVMTVHDLSPWIHRGLQPEAGRIRWRTPWLLHLGMADLVITVSEAMRKDVTAHFGLDAERVRAVPLAADARFRPEAAEIVTGDRARRRPYLFYAGTLEPRKGIPELVKAWRGACASLGVELWIAGRRRADFPFTAEADGLHWLGAVTDEELAGLYAGALAVVYPSRYEGFGLPALEAMQSGAPVVVGDAPALRELVGDAGLVVKAGDARALGEALRVLVKDDELRRRLSEKGLRRAAEFSWTRTARETRYLYLEAMQHFAK